MTTRKATATAKAKAKADAEAGLSTTLGFGRDDRFSKAAGAFLRE
jgi:hypothetical protein